MSAIQIDPTHPTIVCLETMIKWTLSCQDKFEHFKQTHTQKSWLKEFCTIKFCLPRQSGHTNAGVYLAKKYFVNPVFIVLNSDVGKKFVEKGVDSNNIHLFNSFDSSIRKSYNFVNCVVIDMASFMSKTMNDKIYDEINFDKNNKNLIIFLE